MQIWFSTAPQEDRELAFAPIRVVSEREELAPTLVATLKRFSANDPLSMAEGAAKARACQDRIETSLVEVAGRRSDLNSEERLLLLVQVSVGLIARRMPQIVRGALAAYHNKWLHLENPAAFLSYVARAVFEGFTSTDLEPMKREIEALLENERNFRTVLAYCLKAYRDDFSQCIEKFYTLWERGHGLAMRDVWSVVADRLDGTFSRAVVIDELGRIRLETASNLLSTGLLAAEKLSPFYPLERQGLVAMDMKQQEDGSARGFGLRDIKVDWVLAALDLYLDMERNLSDNRFAGDPANEIIYTFDEDIFELFVGGKDQEQIDQRRRGFIYTDRRRAVGVFHIKAWRTGREREHLAPKQEEQRADINRQSAMLTTEWLFSGKLPGRKDSSIYISRQHFGELSSRWETLITNFRPKLPTAASIEHRYIVELEQDHATSAHTSDDAGGTIVDYLRATPEPLRSDLSELWKAIGSRKGAELTAAMRSFWQFAFSRKLAATLASLEVTEPISQLLRINGDIAGRLRFLHQVMAPDEPEKIPRSETFGFWKERLDREIEVRKKRTPAYSRDGHAVDNDAHTMALVQALANTAVRGGIPRRFVLVTADPLLIDAYRAWHCREAEQFEPFVLRPVRHFAPLLNISSMSEGEERGADEWKEKEDLFPLLREAIEPFLLKLNLAADGSQSGHEDSVRWYREQYALKLRLALRNYNANPSSPQRDEVLQAEVADQMIFPTALRDLDAVNSKLMEIIEKGRTIERFAIGFGFRWFNQRLAARKELQEAQREFSKGDEAPLARFMQRMLTEFGSTNLDLRVKFASISSDLQVAVNRDKRSRRVSRKVPLVLNLTLDAPGSVESSIASQANLMVKQALSEGETSRRSERSNPLDLDLQNSNIREGGGYRFFALYCCIALALNEWSVAYHCATEAYDRGAKDPKIGPLEFIELEYLFAVCIRFRIGAGPIRDAGGANISFERYGLARQLLQDRAKSIVAFVDLRAASELSALILFGCAWSIAEAASPTTQNSFPSALVESEFGECITLLTDLYDRIEPHIDGRSSFAGSEASQYLEVEEQIAVNIAAAYCFTQLGLRSDDTEAFKDYAALFERASRALAWVAEFAKQCRSGGRNCSHIGQFYFSWFEFLRGTSSELRLKNEVDEMNLRIDGIIASRFRRDLLTST